MTRLNRCTTLRRETIAAVVAIALLAGCGARSGAVLPASAVPNILPGAGANAIVADAAPPKCKGQKNTKQYASVASQAMKSKGGSVCVPAFGGWGGALQFPSVSGTSSVSLISSTKPYNPALFPPPGSQTAIFYLQFSFSGFPTFGQNLPGGNALASTHVTPNKSYTVELTEKIGSGLWTPLAQCYSVAKTSQYGGGIPRVGAAFIGQFFREPNAVIEIFSGKLVSNKC